MSAPAVVRYLAHMSTSLRHAHCRAAFSALTLGISSAANAQDAGAAGASDRWVVELTPYLWAAGLDGNTAANGTGSEIDTDYKFFSLDNPPIPRANARETWLDPLVGLRFTHTFNDRWSVALRGDIGGAGISSESSELATNVSAIFGWRLGDNLTLRGGYRLLQMDFDGDELVLDATLQGYVIGASWAF